MRSGNAQARGIVTRRGLVEIGSLWPRAGLVVALGLGTLTTSGCSAANQTSDESTYLGTSEAWQDKARRGLREYFLATDRRDDLEWNCQDLKDTNATTPEAFAENLAKMTGYDLDTLVAEGPQDFGLGMTAADYPPGTTMREAALLSGEVSLEVCQEFVWYDDEPAATGTEAPSGTDGSTDALIVGADVARISQVSSIAEANALFDSYMEGAQYAGVPYRETAGILTEVLNSGDLSILVQKYAMDKGEINLAIDALSRLIQSQDANVHSITPDQNSVLLDTHVWVTPEAQYDWSRGLLALLDALRQLPEYESTIPESLVDCDGDAPMSDRMIAEPLGLPLAREIELCTPPDDLASRTSFDPQLVQSNADALLDELKKDSKITQETLTAMSNWAAALLELQSRPW